MSKAIDLLEKYKPGDRLRADDVNALIEFAKQQRQNLGFQDENQYVERYKSKSSAVMACINDIGEALKPYSIFTIAGIRTGPGGTEINTDVPRALAINAGVDPNGSPMLFLTNGTLEIPANAEFEPEMISFDKPTQIRADSTNTPDVGEQCGIAFDTKELTSYRYGLVCLTPSWTESGQKYVWACRSREPIKIIGCVTNKITKSFIDAETDKRHCGVGYVQVLYRDSGNLLNQVKRPSQTSEQWKMRVWNYTEIEYNVGMLISASDTLGIGLTVNNEVTNTLCNSSGSSA